MKTEVLNDIKKTETEYQSMISAAQEDKKKRTFPGRTGS